MPERYAPGLPALHATAACTGEDTLLHNGASRVHPKLIMEGSPVCQRSPAAGYPKGAQRARLHDAHLADDRLVSSRHSAGPWRPDHLRPPRRVVNFRPPGYAFLLMWRAAGSGSLMFVRSVSCRLAGGIAMGR
jgi:hypothetical protein